MVTFRYGVGKPVKTTIEIIATVVSLLSEAFMYVLSIPRGQGGRVTGRQGERYVFGHLCNGDGSHCWERALRWP